MKKDLAYYRGLPYSRQVDRDDEGYFVASIPELPGCFATGGGRPEALANLKTVFDEYIEAKLEWGAEIPEPDRVPHRGKKARGWEQVEGRGQASGPAKISNLRSDSFAESTG